MGFSKVGESMETKDLVSTVVRTVVKYAVIAAVILLIYYGATTCYDYGYRIFMEPAMTTEENAQIVEVTVPADMSPKEIGELFEFAGLVRDGKLFTLQYYLSEFRKDVQPGTFHLSTAMTAEELMEAMTVTEELEEE